MERDFYMDADAAVRYGVADQIRYPGQGGTPAAEK